MRTSYAPGGPAGNVHRSSPGPPTTLGPGPQIPPGIQPSPQIPPGIQPTPRAPMRMHGLGQNEGPSTTAIVYGAVSTASMAVSAYHGYRRNDSLGWALWWALMGGMFPVITPTIAVAQGFGERQR